MNTTETFFEWLCLQAGRSDGVGAFARFAMKDPIFPRGGRKLNLFLLRCEGMPERRDAAKVAHREWRNARKASR